MSRPLYVLSWIVFARFISTSNGIGVTGKLMCEELCLKTAGCRGIRFSAKGLQCTILFNRQPRIMRRSQTLVLLNRHFKIRETECSTRTCSRGDVCLKSRAGNPVCVFREHRFQSLTGCLVDEQGYIYPTSLRSTSDRYCKATLNLGIPDKRVIIAFEIKIIISKRSCHADFKVFVERYRSLNWSRMSNIVVKSPGNRVIAQNGQLISHAPRFRRRVLVEKIQLFKEYTLVEEVIITMKGTKKLLSMKDPTRGISLYTSRLSRSKSYVSGFLISFRDCMNVRMKIM